MNYFEYQLCQPSNMPKLSHEKHEICLVPKMSCVSYNEQQLFQASNVPRSLMTNMNNFEYQLCQGSIMLSLNYENINYVMSQILKLSCVSFRYVSISYVLADIIDQLGIMKNAGHRSLSFSLLANIKWISR